MTPRYSCIIFCSFLIMANSKKMEQHFLSISLIEVFSAVFYTSVLFRCICKCTFERRKVVDDEMDGCSAALLSWFCPGAGVLWEQQQPAVHSGAGPLGEVHRQTRDIWPEQTSCGAAAGHGCTVRRRTCSRSLLFPISVTAFTEAKTKKKVLYPLD